MTESYTSNKLLDRVICDIGSRGESPAQQTYLLYCTAALLFV